MTETEEERKLENTEVVRKKEKKAIENQSIMRKHKKSVIKKKGLWTFQPSGTWSRFVKWSKFYPVKVDENLADDNVKYEGNGDLFLSDFHE